ncbi:uncharacterized protein LOC111393809 isoform X1 [Olea europaea var. sylvestris]|uniref:uncharacterized protein LOC111393809 isoform X1 n=1 Tax=Olea europaea var. sylvestris TaxID=158386 RepID=UPI000C1CFAEF|nr:uncharacterized protein LOC111393809 isoform X1 [Olea europaea var. sylvestris]XP_022875288.1 uncharacterized protein LOC111393809 isoform X1 [Olea europaea var. sylvestris]
MESHARLYGYVQALVFGILKALGEILKKRIDHAIIRLFSILKMLTKESDAMYFAVNIVCDHVSGKSEGNVFVHYAEEIAASKALKKLMASCWMVEISMSNMCIEGKYMFKSEVFERSVIVR